MKGALGFGVCRLNFELEFRQKGIATHFGLYEYQIGTKTVKCKEGTSFENPTLGYININTG